MSRKLPVYSPSKLTRYERCPFSYWKVYIDDSMPTQPATPALARGQVTHTILSESIRKFAGGADLPETVDQRALELMREYDHFDEPQIAMEGAQAAQLAEFALDHFDVTASPVLVERQTAYDWHTRSGRGFARLTARVDVILKHQDGTFEIIDWKTGDSTFQDPIQNLLLFVTGAAYLQERFDVPNDAIRLTVAYLGAKQYTAIETSRETFGMTWRHVGELIKRIHDEQHWKATSNNLCEYCPLFQNGCPLEGPDYLEMDSSEV